MANRRQLPEIVVNRPDTQPISLSGEPWTTPDILSEVSESVRPGTTLGRHLVTPYAALLPATIGGPSTASCGAPHLAGISCGLSATIAHSTGIG